MTTEGLLVAEKEIEVNGYDLMRWVSLVTSFILDGSKI